MSTPQGLGEELVSSLGEGLRSGGGKGRGRPCSLQGSLAGRPQRPCLGVWTLSSALYPVPGAGRLGGGPSLPWVTSETPRAIPEAAAPPEVGFPKFRKSLQPPSVPLSEPCFPTLEGTQVHPKQPCPEGTLHLPLVSLRSREGT